MKKTFLLCLLSFLYSCSRVQTLNLEPHRYSERPNHILWIQLAGFSEEHIPLLRFNVSDVEHHTSIEKVDCLGKAWNYNLFNLRPMAFESFLAQSLGTKNIKNNCEDYKVKSVWSFLAEMGYKVGIIESGADENQSLEKSLDCTPNEVLNLNMVRFYRMAPLKNNSDKHSRKLFHYQESPEALAEIMKPGIYYDKSCQKDLCYSSLSNNFKTLWNMLSKDQNQTFFLVRNFDFQNNLKRKDISSLKESLQEIDQMIAWIKSQKRDDVLIIISGAESLSIEYPVAGKEWADFEKTGKNVLFKNSSLMSPVLASGVMAENFCGIYEESELTKRILQKSEKKYFNWDNLIPFSN